MRRSLASVSLIAMSTALGVATPAVAQTQPAPTPSSSSVEPTPAPSSVTKNRQPSVPAAEPASASADIIVTGSRIRRPDFSSPNPVVSLGSQRIEQAGNSNLTDILTGYPALQGSSGSTQNAGDQAGIGSTGINLLNLRNLGSDRTLVLVDGRRHVSGVAGSAAVDINSIPEDLIDRIDIQTGGASAIYGADAVSGAVNFILKKNFSGISAHAQAGISEHGDAGQRLFSITAGRNFAGSRGNIAVAFEHGEEDRLTTSNRPYLTGANSVSFQLNPDNPLNTGGAAIPGVPQYVPITDVRYAATARQGAIGLNSDFAADYFIDGQGQLVPFDQGLSIPGGYAQGGSATSLADYGNDLLPKIRRNVVNLLGHFDVSPALTIFAEGKYATTKSFSLAQPTFDYYLVLPADNAFIPPDLAPLVGPDGIQITRDNFDFGQRGENIRRDTLRGVIGARGTISPNATYEVSYVYGQTKVTNHYINDIITDRYYAALDAVRGPNGQITCRINVDPTASPFQPYNPTRSGGDNGAFAPVTFQPGQCVPLNILGEGAPSPAALDFIRANTTDRSKITQQVLSGSVSGDFGRFFSFPGGGKMGFAFGGEYRREKSTYTPDALIAQGLTFSNKSSANQGNYNVKEAFAELRAPLLTRERFAYALEVGAAIRLSKYSSIGHTKTYNIDASYSPIRDITFNGTYSTAVRAPNIGELFNGQSQTFNFINDPCNSGQQGLGTSYRVANCAALLTAAGVTSPSAFIDTRSTNIGGITGGNPALRPETAKTWTAGVVLQPRFVPGLTARADYYDIRLKNAINTVSAEQLAQLCVDQPTINNQFCAAITRQIGSAGTGLPGYIVNFQVTPQNVAQFRTAGLDVNVNYRLRTARIGTFNLNLIGNYLDKLQFVGTPGADITDSRGETYAPKYTVRSDLTWNVGRFTINYGLLYFSKTLRFSNLATRANPNIVAPQYLYLKEHWQHDIFAKIAIAKQFEFSLGVNNVFNQKPELGTSRYPVSAVGRFLYAGVRVNLDGAR